MILREPKIQTTVCRLSPKRLLLLLLSCLALIRWSERPKIDVVFTYVNGSDVEWQRERARFEGGGTAKEADTENRYRDNGELKYAVRSVYKHFPIGLLGTVYIVVASERQIPSWLELESGQVQVVMHEELGLDLPTFSSPAIEAKLDMIPNLRENFLYFNDDVFLAQDVTLDDFFIDNKQKIYLAWEIPSDLEVETNYIDLGSNEYSSKPGMDAFGMSLSFVSKKIDTKFPGRFIDTKRTIAHMPHFIQKSIFQELKQTFPEEFKQTASNQFRSPNDMQFAFSYFYFLMVHAQNQIKVSYYDVWDFLDTDNNNILSDNELRTISILISRYDIDLEFESERCRHLVSGSRVVRYWDLVSCEPIVSILAQHIASTKIPGYILASEEEKKQSMFIMLNSENLDEATQILDEVRLRRPKFLCINDNMDSSTIYDQLQMDATRKHMLQTLQFLYPLPSPLEKDYQPPTYFQINTLIFITFLLTSIYIIFRYSKHPKSH